MEVDTSTVGLSNIQPAGLASTRRTRGKGCAEEMGLCHRNHRPPHMTSAHFVIEASKPGKNSGLGPCRAGAWAAAWMPKLVRRTT